MGNQSIKMRQFTITWSGTLLLRNFNVMNVMQCACSFKFSPSKVLCSNWVLFHLVWSCKGVSVKKVFLLVWSCKGVSVKKVFLLVWSCKGVSVKKVFLLLWSCKGVSVKKVFLLVWSCKGVSVKKVFLLVWSCQGVSVKKVFLLVWSCKGVSAKKVFLLVWSCQRVSVKKVKVSNLSISITRYFQSEVIRNRATGYFQSEVSRNRATGLLSFRGELQPGNRVPLVPKPSALTRNQMQRFSGCFWRSRADFVRVKKRLQRLNEKSY